MKLRTIEAQSFGLLKGIKLDDLGDGLNIVCGPNESGKTTLRELVRMVLYGFPDGRSKDNPYIAPDGSRSARLIFEGEDGVWAVGRSGDKKGAPKVEAIAGPEKPSLREDIIGNVTDQTYRVLFGFGLEELPAIGTPGDDAVLARVYGEAVASGKSLKVVRDTLTKSSEGILSRSGGAGVLGKDTWKAIKATRARISDLESTEREFAADQGRLKKLEADLAAAKAKFEGAEGRARTLALDAQRARDLTTTLAELEIQLDEVTTLADEQRSVAKRCKVDDRMLELGPELEALLEDAKLMRSKDEHARQRDELASERRRRADSLGLPADLQVHDGDRARIQAWQAEKPVLEAAASQALAAAERAEAHAQGESVKAQAAGVTGGPGAARALALAMLVVGAAGVAAGLLMNQVAAAGMGLVVAVLAAMLLLSGRGGAVGITHDSVRAQGEAAEARAEAESAQARLAAAQSQWEAWVASRGLGGRGTDIAAVQSLLEAVAERDGHLDAAASLLAEAEAAREVAMEWAEKLVTLVKGPLGIADQNPEPQALAIRAREELGRVKKTRDDRDAALKLAEDALAQRDSLTKKVESARERLDAISQAHATSGEVVGSLEGMETQAKAEADTARNAVEQAAGEYGALSGKLDSEGRDAAITLARQELEGLLTTARQQAEEYLVESLALSLVNGAIKRFEEEQQPDVIRVAQGLFGEMTDGRYVALRVPAGMAEINVLNSEGRQMSSGQLSSGAREQLYLALRVALISNLGGLAPALPVLMDDIMANYDAERVRDAVCAILELVKVRQVLFFTCHQATADALAAGVPGSRVHQLARCAF